MQATQNESSQAEQKFLAPDMGSALRLLADTLGPDAILLSSRKVNAGVEVIAMPPGATPVSRDYEAMHTERRSADRRRAPERRRRATTVAQSENQTAHSTADDAGAVPPEALSEAASRIARSLGDLGGVAEPAALDSVRGELNELRQMLAAGIGELEASRPRELDLPQPVIYLLQRRLRQMGFPASLCRQLVADIPADSTVESGWQQCLEQVAGALSGKPLAEGARIAVCGPSGAGKSALVVKLAAQWLLEHEPGELAIISFDTGSALHHSPLGRFASLSGVPVLGIDRQHSLAERIAQTSHARRVLIDTIAQDQDPGRFASQQEALQAAPVETLLALPATGERRWLARAIEHYALPNVRGCALTHVDHSAVLGPLVTVLLGAGLPLLHLSRGPLLPESLQGADTMALQQLLRDQPLPDDEPLFQQLQSPTVNMSAFAASAEATG